MKILFAFLFCLLFCICLASCFIPERRIYFPWTHYSEREECNYDFITKENISVVRENIGSLINVDDKEIYYDIGETQYKSNYTYPYILNEVIDFMKENENAILIVEGHSDTLAYKSKKVNFSISERRAEIVKDFIVKSIPEERVKTYPYSDIKPRYETEKDRNRRVDFIAVKCRNELESYDEFYSNYMDNFLKSIGNK